MPPPSIKWETEIDQQFGRLGDVVASEIVEHGKNQRSVYLYYQGTKRPAKVWVTFTGTDIDGLHWNVWQEGYEDRESTLLEKLTPFFILMVTVLMGVFPILCIFLGERFREQYVQRLRDVYIYQDEHRQSCYTEAQNPAWGHVLFYGLALLVIAMLVPILPDLRNAPTIIDVTIIVAALTFSAFLCVLLGLLFAGFFIEVDDQYLTVRMGTFRIRVLRLELKSICTVETVKFCPIRDFGGWGIRMAGNGWAYFWSGTEGVQLTTVAGKYTIGSDIPDRLARVIQEKVNAVNAQ